MAERENPAGELVSYREDTDSFTLMFDAAVADAFDAFNAAPEPVLGAEARTRAATTDLVSLRAFEKALQVHVRNRSFRELPGMMRGRERLEAYHKLTIGPWRGVFLVRPDGSEAIGVLFSRHPHNVESRLEEIIRRYTPPQGDNG